MLCCVIFLCVLILGKNGNLFQLNCERVAQQNAGSLDLTASVFMLIRV